METRPHSPLVQGLTVVVALTLMSGFVVYRHHNSPRSGPVRGSALVADSPETQAANKQVHLDSFYFDASMPSTKSGMIIPPDHPAFQQAQIDTMNKSVTTRSWFSSSKSLTPLFEPPLTLRDSFQLELHGGDTLQ